MQQSLGPFVASLILGGTLAGADRFAFSAGPQFGLSDGRNAAGQGMAAEMAWRYGDYDLGVEVETMRFALTNEAETTSARTRALMLRLHRVIADSPISIEGGVGTGTATAGGRTWTLSPLDVGVGVLMLRRDAPGRSASLECALFYRFFIADSTPSEFDSTRLGGFGLALRGLFRF